jgi:hypothetical protein
LAGFWSNSDFEFLLKINAQDVACNCSLQKTGSKKFPLKLDSFRDKTLDGNWQKVNRWLTV